VLSGADSGLIEKTITSVSNNNNGTFTIGFTFTSSRPDGTYRLRDCAYVGSSQLIAGTDDMSYTLSGGTGAGSITVPGSSGDTVCDRLALSSSVGGFTDKSNQPCVQLGGNQVPVGTIGAIGAAGIGAVALGGLILYRRRRALQNW
jgi:hypothetical protein